MITASHNQYIDNGLKICSEEKMLSPKWEEYYIQLANSKNLIAEIKLIIQNIIDNNLTKSKYFFRDVKPIACVGSDTRRSCPALLKLIL